MASKPGHEVAASPGGFPSMKAGARAYAVRLAWISGALAVSGCTSVPGVDAGHQPAASLAIVEVWEYPAAEFPTMCMVLLADGALQFRGGFAYFNPGAWRRDQGAHEIVITLGGSAPFPTASAQEALQARPRSLHHFDPVRRELHFADGANRDTHLSVGGFNFYRSARCGAA